MKLIFVADVSWSVICQLNIECTFCNNFDIHTAAECWQKTKNQNELRNVHVHDQLKDHWYQIDECCKYFHVGCVTFSNSFKKFRKYVYSVYFFIALFWRRLLQATWLTPSKTDIHISDHINYRALYWYNWPIYGVYVNIAMLICWAILRQIAI